MWVNFLMFNNNNNNIFIQNCTWFALPTLELLWILPHGLWHVDILLKYLSLITEENRKQLNMFSAIKL